MNEALVVPAVPSATVVVARQGASGPELLMVRRRAGDAFGDSYAFPGGVLDHDESASHAFCEGSSEAATNERLRVDDGGLDYYVAAIRELFEETGILLARDTDGNWVSDYDDDRTMQEQRKRVDRGEMRWSQFLKQRGLVMACDALHYFAHWETPVKRPKRWSARFFLAELPPGQDATHDGTELTDCRWLSAAQVLANAREGNMELPYPTTRTLEWLAAHDSVASLKAWADSRVSDGIDKVRPMWITTDGKPRWVIPGDTDYPDGGDGCP